MNENRFPSDPMQDLRDLQRVVADDKAAAAGSALLEASAGWVLRDRSTPPLPPSGDVHIYAQGGRLWQTSTFGTIPLLDAASHVAPVTGTVGATYTTFEQGKINELITTLAAVIASLIGAGHMDP